MSHRDALRAAVAVVAVAAALSALTACTGAGQAVSGVVDIHAGEPPEFSGPFADQFREAWTQADSEFVREVLADEAITDRELAEVIARLGTCVDRTGMRFISYDDGGSYEVDTNGIDGDQANELLGSCETESGEHPIAHLHRQQISNPQNRDFSEITTECLIRRGAVAPDYRTSQFTEDYQNLEIPFVDGVDGVAALETCQRDPLGLSGTQ